MVKYMVCIIHRWLRWSNIWFTSYTDGEKKFFFCNEALFVAPGQGPGVS